MRTISLLAVAACLILVGVAVRAAATPPHATPANAESYRGATPVGGGLYVLPPVF
jgi:hypothetical protein